MLTADDFYLAFLMFAAATLYSSVGHAGASGYLAAMALFGLSPAVMRPTALALNILVAAVATFRYAKAGQSDFRQLLPFVVTSVPAAFIGGYMHIPPEFYRPLVGAVLLLAALQFARTANSAASLDLMAKPPPASLALASGAGLGLLAGLTGTGGGIFLSPLMLFMHWTTTRKASGIAASFILVNSIAGLAGTSFALQTLPSAMPVWAIAVLAGGALGTWLGSKKLAVPGLRHALAGVLIIASLKMLLS